MFSIPVHELIKRPGEMRELVMQFDLDQELGTGYAAVQKGQWLKLDLRLESVHEGILATGEVKTEASTECSRCLDEMNLPIEVDFQELFAYSSSSDDELLVDGDHIDLEQVVIDSVVLSLPFQPVCSQDCLGLCAECGFRLNEDPNHKHEVKVDPRFSALEGFLSKEE
ncbi:MAG: DUF177 domain-containing protein [Actinobacteria bacterium]|nr:DUF177 domain-containing protein [Actinomycetota bacterium]